MSFQLDFPTSAGLRTDTNTEFDSFQPLRAPKSEAQNQNGVSKGSSEYLGTYKNMFADSVPNIMAQLRLSSSEKKSPFVDSSNCSVRLATGSSSVFYKGIGDPDQDSVNFSRLYHPRVSSDFAWE